VDRRGKKPGHCGAHGVTAESDGVDSGNGGCDSGNDGGDSRSAGAAQMTKLPRVNLLLAVIVVGMLWGLVPALGKIALEAGANPVGLTLWQGLGAAVLLLALTFARGRRLPLGRPHLVLYVIGGVTGTALPTFVIFTATQHISIGVISILIALVPLLTYAAGLPLRIETVSAGRLAGVALGFTAVVMLALPGAAVSATAAAGLWVMTGLLVPLSYTVENLYVALRRPPGTDPVAIVAGMAVFSVLVLAPLTAAGGKFTALSINPAAMGKLELAVAGIMAINAACYVAFVHMIKISGPLFASLIGYAIMLFGVLWGIWLFNESHTPWVWTAMVAMLTGMALVRERPV